MKVSMKNFIFATFYLVACNSTSNRQAAITKTDSATVDLKTVNNNKYDSLSNAIDFKATGNEPFWLLEIDFDKFIHFKTLNGLDITTPVPEGVKAADANVTRYRAVTEQEELIIQIAKRECINDMSGKKSDYSVSVDVKNNSDKDYVKYKGCGEYLADYRINDTLVLDSINSHPIDKANFTKELPRLEINLAEKSTWFWWL